MRFRSDEHLVRLFREGREDAFDAIHDRHARRLQAVAARTRVADPEGVVQEAFLRAHRTLRDDRRHIELKPWLHRVVRNICIDELRKERATVEYTDEGASEDVYATLSRRHELRALIEDLADLPEQQRAALLMRELDGLSHDEVAEVLEITPQASRQLVKRARTGLTAAAAARDADCPDIRDDLLTAHDEKRRPSEHTVRHLKTCSGCREFRAQLKSTRSRLRALTPPVGLGPLAGVLGGAATGGTKLVAAGACCAVLAAGGATAWVAGQKEVVRDTSPGVEAGGRTLIDKPIRPGTALPKTVAISNLTVALDGKRQHAEITCPDGMTARGLAQPRTRTGKAALGALRMYQLANEDVDRLGHRRTARIDFAGKSAGPVVSIGLICKRR